MVSEDTLRVKHLPPVFSKPEVEEFLTHFGAIQVKLIKYPKDKLVAFARFENAEVAKAALFRLHQLTVLNSRLSVDYAEDEIGLKQPKLKEIQDDNVHKKCFKKFISKLHSFNSSVGFNQPPPPHLRYEYPKPNRATINNIAHVLLTVPKFYTQVLHLMNRMHLPPPFVIETLKPPTKPQPVEEKPSSSESEIESDGESKNKEIIPERQNVSQRKIMKRPKFIKPTTKQVVVAKKPRNEVFDESVEITKRRIELNVSGESISQSDTKEREMEVQSEDEDLRRTGKVITDEELKSNQIPFKDLGVLKVFRDYHPGIPTNRLYLKNLGKNVTVQDLEYIFDRYKTEVKEGETSAFEIKLMQEGRMKGQAFITLQNVQVAQKAVEETNGFILKDKPLVVAFAKGASKLKN